MYRHELEYTDNEIIDIVSKGYGIKILKLNYVDIGSFYVFILDIENNNKLFLKIYPKEKSLVPIQPTIQSLNKMGTVLHRLRHGSGIKNLSYCIPNLQGKYCYETPKFIFIIFEYVEGFHPEYSPNQLNSDKLAEIFTHLHSVPPSKFPDLDRENFDIQFALGIAPWIYQQITIINTKNADVMLAVLHKEKGKLIHALENLQNWQDIYSKKVMNYVITHGDPHHYNVLQTPLDLWLVDWDGIKIAPIERDLWFYEDMPLFDIYSKLNNNYKIDIQLCHFYRLQRFLEDIHYYLNQVLLGKNSTVHQSEEDKDNFLNHWGWKLCL